MATGTIILPILAAVPDPTNPPALGFTSTLGAPNLSFDSDTDELVTFHFRMPVDYASGPVLNIQWFGNTATSGAVMWRCAVLKNAGESTDTGAFDSETFATINYQSDSHLGTTATRLHDCSITLSNFDSGDADDYIILQFGRDADGTGGTDDYANDASVVALSLEYTTS